MARRLIAMVVKEKDGGEVRGLLKRHEVLDRCQIRLPDGEVLVRILLDAEQGEAVLDLLDRRYTGEAAIGLYDTSVAIIIGATLLAALIALVVLLPKT